MPQLTYLYDGSHTSPTPSEAEQSQYAGKAEHRDAGPVGLHEICDGQDYYRAIKEIEIIRNITAASKSEKLQQHFNGENDGASKVDGIDSTLCRIGDISMLRGQSNRICCDNCYHDGAKEGR